MRRAFALLSILVLGLPCMSAAQVFNCFDCTIGIYDDSALTTNFGVSTTGVPKEVYLGIDFAGAESSLIGIEFSIAGMRFETDGILLLGFELIEPGITIGLVQAPPDTTSTSMGTGGMNVGWSSCLVNDRALARIRVLHFQPVVNHVFQVKRRYPPLNPALWQTPVLTRCDGPVYTAVRVTGGCYMLNWNGDPNVPCAPVLVGVESTTWSGVKQLFH